MDVYGPELIEIADEIVDTYVEVFAEPPFNRDPEKIWQPVRDRLGGDVSRHGFRAVVERSEAGIDGFAYGWITPAPYRTDRSYGDVAEQLGPDRIEKLVIGALEVDELAVRKHTRGTGLGRRLLTELVTDAPDERAWLLTSRNALDTIAFYERIGWHRVEPLPGVVNGVVVFLSPNHPGA